MDCYLGEIGAAYIDGNMWTFATVPSTTYAGRKSLYGWYTSDGGLNWTPVADMADNLPPGAAHHDEIGFNGRLYVMVNYPDGNTGWHTKYTDDPTAALITWSPYESLNLINGLGHFFVDDSTLYIGILRTNPTTDNKILQYTVSSDSWTEICSASSTGWDPTLFKVNGRYVFAQAPWVNEGGGRQYIIAWSSDTLDSSFFNNPGDPVSIVEGKYGSNTWVDMWPIGFTSAEGTSYLFYTSERNPENPLSEIDGNIWYLTVDWDVTNDHYTYIQEAIDAATSTTINVAAGTYAPFTVDTKTGLTIQSSGVVTVQGAQLVATAYTDRGCVVFVNDSTDIVLDGLDIEGLGLTGLGEGGKNYGVIYENSSGKINNCTVSPNTVEDMVSTAIGIWDGSTVTVDTCTIENFGRLGILIYNGCIIDVLDSTIIGQLYSGQDQVCYGIEVEGAWMSSHPDTASQVLIRGNEIYNCDNDYPEPSWGSAAILVNGWLEYFDAADSTVIIEGNNIHNNYDGIYAIKSPSSRANFNEIYDNRRHGVVSAAAFDDSYEVFDAMYNWWGHVSGPFDEILEGDGLNQYNPDGLGDAVSEWVLYDPWIGQGGMVTGGGWIDSPVGAYRADPQLSGKATFGFVSRYKKGATVPTGNAQFNFQVADLNFHSDNYDWLVVAGDTARFKGWGTINGAGEYRFMLWAGDSNPNTFRIKIWEEDENGTENVVYDNGSQQAIGGGNIVIHKK